MRHGIVLLFLATAMLLGISGGVPSHFTSMAGASTPGATPTPEPTPRPTPPAELCPEPTPASAVEAPATAVPDATPAPWMSAIDVRPGAASAAVIRPRDVFDGHVAGQDENGNVIPGNQDLYLVIWTLRPGTCIPYSAEGNQKDGAVILMVQEGIIEFTAEPYGDDTDVNVFWGHVTSDDGRRLAFGETQRLLPGDWVSMSDRVWFTYTSVGGESAVVLKAVWANLGVDRGCGGGCK